VPAFLFSRLRIPNRQGLEGAVREGFPCPSAMTSGQLGNFAMKTLLLASASLFALGALAPAAAADLPLYGKAPVAPVPLYDWTGVYAGINGGGGIAHACWSIINSLGVAVDPPNGEGCHNASGGTVGGQVGYRWQKAHWVLGIEGQGNWADFKGSNPSLALASVTNQTRIDSFGMITGQLGYAVNSVLFYGKAGAAVAHDKYDSFGAGTPTLATISQARWGYGIGFGVEYGFADNWSIGGAYDHLFLGHHSGDFVIPVAGTLIRTDRIGQDVDVLQLRINYRFSAPAAAVSTKY
jgi:outer membrane immunogenic protein